MEEKMFRTKNHDQEIKNQSFLEDASLTAASEASPEVAFVAPRLVERVALSSVPPHSFTLADVLLSDFFNFAANILFASAKEDNYTRL